MPGLTNTPGTPAIGALTGDLPFVPVNGATALLTSDSILGLVGVLVAIVIALRGRRLGPALRSLTNFAAFLTVCGSMTLVLRTVGETVRDPVVVGILRGAVVLLLGVMAGAAALILPRRLATVARSHVCELILAREAFAAPATAPVPAPAPQAVPADIVGSVVAADTYRKARDRVVVLNAELKKRIEEAEALIDLSPVGIAVAEDLAGHNIYLNRALRDLLGLPSEPDLGLTPAPMRLRLRCRRDGRDVPTEDLPLYRCLATGKPIEGVQFELMRSSGDVRIVLNSARPLFAESGAVRGCVSVYTDVTEQIRSASALRESEERFRRAFEDSPIGIYRAAADGRVVMVNQTALKMVGCATAEEFVQRTPEVLEAGLSGHTNCLGISEFSWQLPDGAIIHVRENVRQVRDRDGRTLYYEGTLEDVTERRLAERELREREALFRNIIATIPCGVFWKDRQSIYLGCNEQFARTQGLDSPRDIVGKSDCDLPYAPLTAESVRALDLQVIETGLPILNLEEMQQRPAGKVTFLISKVPLRNHADEVIGVLGTTLDLTEQKRLEEQFLQAQKMEAVGRLAGGIAHDFNNLLTVIAGNADWIGQLSAGSDSFSERLDDLRDAASRAAGLVRQLLTFSRRQASRPEVLNLNEVLGALIGMLRRMLGEKIKVVTDLAAETMRIRADRVQLEQVVMNLVVNVRDAMPGGGTLTLATRLIQCSPHAPREDSLALTSQEPRPDAEREDDTPEQFGEPIAQLLVSDTGCGMTDEVKAKIFEPFFTTKGPDAGTGLGLATVHGIVHQSGGRIAVDTEPGRGTTFRIEFPTIAQPITPPPERGWSALIPRAALGRGRAVLLVEDEDAVRALARITLESQGYTVTEAADAETALAQFDRARPLDLLVTDLTMPGMDGQELAESLRVQLPNLGVLFMSGYVPETDRLERLHKTVFLQKPFSPAQLLDSARQLLRGDWTGLAVDTMRE